MAFATDRSPDTARPHGFVRGVVLIGLTAIGSLAACTLTGCYERVVSAHGFGADQYNVSESYQSQSALDDWIFGKQERTKKTLLPGE